MEADPLQGHPRYQTIRQLRSGGAAFVLLARDNERNEEVVIKFLSRRRYIHERVEREIMKSKNLLHPHVVQFKQVFLTDHYLAIVMEYADGGNLLNYVRVNRGISEDMARWIFQQLIIGLDYLHRMGVPNQDIKLERILLKGGTWPFIKIRDLTLSYQHVFDPLPTKIIAVPYPLPPEVMRSINPEYGSYDGKKADIWCCGVLLYAMFVGHYPFTSLLEDRPLSLIRYAQRIVTADCYIPEGKMPAKFADLIRRILVVDPEQRADISEIQQHDWFQKKLPEGALSMNNRLLTQDVQSETEIKAILEQARNT